MTNPEGRAQLLAAGKWQYLFFLYEVKNTSEDEHSTCPLNSSLPLMIQKVLPISRDKPSPFPLYTEVCSPICVARPMDSCYRLMPEFVLSLPWVHRITAQPTLEETRMDHRVQLLPTNKLPPVPHPSQPCLLTPETRAEHLKKGKKRLSWVE